MNTYACIASHPFIPSANGIYDLTLRDNDAPRSIVVPVYDHHEIDEQPIGVASLTFTKICFDNTGNRQAVIAMGSINTAKELSVGQGVSISSPLLETVGKFDVLGDPIEISIVDVPSIPNCRIINLKDLETELLQLYRHAPNFVDRLRETFK